MLRILANDGMAKSAVAALEAKGHEVVTDHIDMESLKTELRNFDVIVIRSATKIRKELIEAVKGSQLKLIIRAGVGMDNIDIPDAEAAGIAVRNTPNSSSDAVAELTIGHMFSLARYIYAANVTMRKGEWNKKQYKGVELAGKRLGMIGFGRIARSVAKKAQALGMEVVYYDHKGVFPECKEMCLEFDEVIKTSDFISLHIPFFKEHGPTFTAKEFAMMKDGVYMVNCARGGVVDEDALLDALNSGKVAGAAVDVFVEEPTKNEALVNHDRVCVTPHIGASTAEAQDRIGDETIAVIESFFA